jgi:hypothetical protein
MNAPKGLGAGGGAGAIVPNPIRTVDSAWTLRDRLGALAVRFALGRMSYRVEPGLYALEKPDPAAPVFVTANYKLTFDRVRRALRGRNAWLLVLDTHGINVWCAAGKGTFSTAELCRRIAQTGLAQVVSHRRLILPQLGAVGVAAHQVAAATGFTVVYGPVRAEDIPAWLGAGRKKSPAMRTVRFDFLDRLILVPVEIREALRYAPVLLAVAAGLALIRGRGWTPTGPALVAGYATEFFGAILVSAVLVPALLPALPGRAFSVKGAITGIIWAFVMVWAGAGDPTAGWLSAFHGGFTTAGALLVIVALAAYVALNFTGATVFTSQSGTMLETKTVLPIIILGSVAGLMLQVIGAVRGEWP